LTLGVLITTSIAASAEQPAQRREADRPREIRAAAAKLGRGINLGNALEAPKEGEWGVQLKAEYFPAIKKAGFATVRLPVRWSAHGKRRRHTPSTPNSPSASTGPSIRPWPRG